MRRDTVGVKTMFDALRLRDVDTVTTRHDASVCVAMTHDESCSVTKMLGASPREDDPRCIRKVER